MYVCLSYTLSHLEALTRATASGCWASTRRLLTCPIAYSLVCVWCVCACGWCVCVCVRVRVCSIILSLQARWEFLRDGYSKRTKFHKQYHKQQSQWTHFCSSIGTSLAESNGMGGEGRGSTPSHSSPTLASILSQRSTSWFSESSLGGPV